MSKRKKVILIKILFLTCVFAIGPLSLKFEMVNEYCIFIFFCVVLFFVILLQFMQKCPNCKKLVGDRYAIMNGEEKFFLLFPKKCPYCGQSFVKENKSKEDASALAARLMESSLNQYTDD